MMSLRSRKLVESATNEQDNCHHHKRRWRLAFTAIYFTRLLTKKLLQNNVRLLRSVSYVSIDVQPTNNKGNDLHGPQLSFINVDKKILNEMIRDKNFEFLTQLGGVKQVASNLQTDTKNGIIDNNDHYDVLRRKNVFGANTYQKPPTKGFLSFVFDALKDTTIIILMVCAVLSLGFGIKQNGWKDGWFDGGSIIVAVFLVLAVSAVSNFNQSRQFEKLSIESGDIRVEVVRNGRRQLLSIFDIVVGDVVNLKIGDQIPADGLFLEGHSLKIDESSMTGESDHVEINNASPFLLSGTKVTDGFGFMLVTSVGMNTAWGEMMSSISRDLDEETPLQERLNKLTSYIGKIGMVVALLVLVVLMVRYFTGYTKNERGMKEFNGSKTKLDDTMNSVLNIISAAVTIVVVAIPEGLPLAVTLTLAYSMKKMMNHNAMVRKLSACETMGSATTICTDKTGTLTLNEMKVTDFWMGKEALTLRESSFSQMEPTILALLQQAVGLNTTGSVYKPVSSLVPEVSGSPTEKAILSWAVSSLGVDIEEVRQEFEIIHVETFNSEKKRSGVLIKRNYSNNAIETHWKGAAEMILSMCSFYCDRFGAIRVMNDQDKTQLGTIIQNMAAKSLRCIAFAHKKVEVVDNMQQLEETELTLLGIVGLKDPCRPGVKTAVESCRAAGVNIKMITGDNVHTARAIAIECGILEQDDEDMEDGAVIEGIQFRNYLPEERMEMINKIRVMARSSPFDKLLMVQCLKQKGHVVAVTGDGTNDAPSMLLHLS